MEPVHPANTNLRRAPVQQRSADRLARILDACADLLDETGYEQLSTRAVAARAGVPIGSVYRFFSNKRALVDALAHRNLDRYAEGITGRLAGVPADDWRAAIDAVLDEYLAMKRSAPGFALVDFGAPAPAKGPAGDANVRVAERLADLLVAHLGRLPDEDRSPPDNRNTPLSWSCRELRVAGPRPRRATPVHSNSRARQPSRPSNPPRKQAVS